LDGVVGRCRNIFAGYLGESAEVTAPKSAVLKERIRIGCGNGHQFPVVEIHNVGKPAATAGVFSVTGIDKLNRKIVGGFPVAYSDQCP